MSEKFLCYLATVRSEKRGKEVDNGANRPLSIRLFLVRARRHSVCLKAAAARRAPVFRVCEAGVAPELFGIGPVPAIRKVLKLAGLTLDQIDLVELNEAFAAQVLACLKELPIDPEKLNVNGGAIALGHPLGCTGAKLTATLLHEMQRRQSKYGLVTMCVGGGMGAAGIFERI
jgi:acetyl-CoA acyltransferase